MLLARSSFSSFLLASRGNGGRRSPPRRPSHPPETACPATADKSTGTPRALQPAAAQTLSEQPAASLSLPSSVPVGLRAQLPTLHPGCDARPRQAQMRRSAARVGATSAAVAAASASQSQRNHGRVQHKSHPLGFETARLHKEGNARLSQTPCGVCGVCGSDDEERAVSGQGRAYVHLIGWQNTWEQAPGVPATPSPP